MKPAIIAILTFIAFTSCETVVDYDVPFQKPHVVVNALLNTDSSVQVKLNRSNFILNDSYNYKPLKGADVKMIIDNETSITLTGDTMGVYTNDYVPKPGQEIAIEVDYADHNKVTSSTVIPTQKAEFKVLRHGSVKSENAWENDNYLDVEVDDPKGENYYALSLYELATGRDLDGDSTTIDSLYRKIHISSDHPELINPIYSVKEILFKDDLFDGKKFQFRIDFGYYAKEYLLVVDLKTIEESYYRYFASMYKQNEADNDPLSEPVPVYNNIENGLGIFSSYTSKIKYYDPE